MKSKKHNVMRVLEAHSEATPDRVIFYFSTPDGTKHVSYKDFAKDFRRVAQGFLDQGVKEGEYVIVVLPMSVELYTCMFALQYIGAIPVFLEFWRSDVHMRTALEQVHPVAAIASSKVFGLHKDRLTSVEQSPTLISTDVTFDDCATTLEELRNTEQAADMCAVEKDTSALITYTSGSSGKPKAVDRSHSFLLAQHTALNRCMPYEEADIDLSVFPVFALHSIGSGISVVIPDIDATSEDGFDLEVLLNQIDVHNVTTLTLSPAVFQHLSENSKANEPRLANIRRIATGGAPISKETVHLSTNAAANSEVLLLYGSTEAEPIAHIDAEELLSDESANYTEDRGVNVGKIDNHLEYKILKITKEPIVLDSAGWSALEVAPGEVGELVIAGEHVCERYLHSEDAFKKAKIVDAEGTVWHRTGDLVRVDEHGYVWIEGRIHNAILRAGTYVFPVSAEFLLRGIPNVSQAAYLGVHDSALGERALAVLETNTADTAELSTAVQKKFEQKGVPLNDIIFVEKIPMDPRHQSKVDYDRLKEQL